MTREELVRQRDKHWARLKEVLALAESATGVKKLGPQGISELAQLYRGLAGDLMRVRRDKLGADLEQHLDMLAARAHNVLYAGTSIGNRLSVLSLVLDFPGALRRNLRFFVLSCLLFFGPAIVAGYAAYVDETYALSILSHEQLEGMEHMYAKGHKEGRAADTDASMTGFYVMNNVGIAFRCFATGVLFGLGPIFYLLFNGLVIGVVVGHVARAGYGENIFSFVSSHGPWELTAIVISGAAGIQMGYALVSTHGRTRLGNLQAHGLELLRQIAGAAVFLCVAALLEGWYSPSSIPVEVKYATGGFGWVLVFGLVAFAGRRRQIPRDVLLLQPPRTKAA
jgi:uncharacterized membrane protein SpoIIM required for sporulation